MNASTLLVLLLIAVLALLAIRRIHRKKLLFHCGGDCQSCPRRCAQRSAPKKDSTPDPSRRADPGC